jgi:hypothetical protein
MAPKLTTGMPSVLLSAFVAKEFSPGVILYIWCPFTTVPKQKYVVVLTTDDPCPLFVINSAYSPCAKRKPILQSCHVPLFQLDYPFLDHDSLLNCSQIETMLREDISDQLMASVSRIQGHLLPSTLTEVRKAVELAGKVTLTPVEVRSILAAIP